MSDPLLEYVKMISRKRGGIEGQIETMIAKPRKARPGRGLEIMESFEGGEDNTTLAKEALNKIKKGEIPTPQQRYGLEAIIDEELRPAFLVTDGKFNADHHLWTHLNDAPFKQRIEKTIRSIGRIELPNDRMRRPYGGTGFIVGKNLIMTNRHVAEAFATGIGSRHIRFIDSATSGIDFLREDGRPTGPVLPVERVAMIHPYWDMALLEVKGLDDREPLRLSVKDARQLPNHDVFIVGYPGFDPRNPADVQHKLFHRTYGVKRVQPGELHGGEKTESYGKLVMAVAHDISTLGGNSGSCVCDLDNGEVLALHFGGRYHEKNFAVPAGCFAQDARVVDAGVQFAERPSRTGHDWDSWWDRADQEAANGGDSNGTTAGNAQNSGNGAPPDNASITTLASNGGAVTVQIPLVITVSLGSPAAKPSVTVTNAESALEGMREPWYDSEYDTRAGYNANFLNDGTHETPADKFSAPIPHAKDNSVLALTKSGENILHYQNFSIAMHAKRRLALFTAANVTKEPKLRKPNPRKKYTRAALSGLGENDQEKWFPDDRMDADHQLPDVFFTKDRKSFDKGHLVRRDDIAWGVSYDELRIANGDSYHVTNCSPQTAELNRSNKGEDNWGDLENHVLSEAASERLCLFSGPVLADDDDIFEGKGEGGVTLKARIPARFWKVVVARIADGIASYGFVLEQDLSGIDWKEFSVPPNFLPAMYPISEIEEMAGVKFDKTILDADQYATARGGEVSTHSGAKRKTRKRK